MDSKDMECTSLLVIPQPYSKIRNLIKTIKRCSYLGIKRLFDLICSLIGIIILLPVSLSIKIIYLVTGDKESIFYIQKRVGKKGKLFQLIKFRTMIPNADKKLEEMLKDKKYIKEWEENQKFDNDPRITKIGNLLRKTSIDELPQLINVLKGDMSLIGPRPLVENELIEHQGNPQIYESVLPGITGWWASHGRSETTYEERLELEYYYIENASIITDLKCLFATIVAVKRKTGAK